MPGIHPGFIQTGPKTFGMNTFESDPWLEAVLLWRIPTSAFTQRIRPDLVKFGGRCGGDIFQLGEQAEAQPPRHIPFDPWGRRCDHIEVSPAWRQLDRVSAEEGLIAIAYERADGEHSRLHQFAKLFLFHTSSAFYTCPLAMTDGAARVIELHGTPELKNGAFRNLTSRDPTRFWTSGQWMTERTGGSDVSSTSTIARADGKGGYALFGDKWFTSATTSQMTMALAKVEGATDPREGLSLFFVELRDSDQHLRNIRINRLKDKLGTRALPTAELTLEGTPGVIVGGVGEGVKKVSSLLNITRLYNSVTALSTMARALYLAKDYALKRSAFGRMLSEQPLHLQTLAALQTEYEGVALLGFHLVHLLGKDETGGATAEESALLRLLTPVLKLWSAKQAIAIVSECIECIGGAGYIEDTGLPRLLRDAQVFSIWEGTTNVLSLDVLRAIAKENALGPFFKDLEVRLSTVKGGALAKEVALIGEAAGTLRRHAEAMAKASPDTSQASARAFAFGIARTYCATLLLEFATWNLGQGRVASVESARHYCRRALVTLPAPEDLEASTMKKIVFG